MKRRAAPAADVRCRRTRCTRPGFKWPHTDLLLCIDHAKKLGRSRYGVARVPAAAPGKRSSASGVEADRDARLTLAEQAGAIMDLRRQVKYEHRVVDVVTGESVLIESYYADFVYIDVPTRASVVEDSKNGLYTEAYLRKRRWMRAEHGITIVETGERWHRGRPPARKSSRRGSSRSSRSGI